MDEAQNVKRIGPWEKALIWAALAVAGFYAVQWGLEGVIHSRNTHTVPDLKGKSLSAALDMVSPLNLGLKKEGSEYNATVPISSVLRQEPAVGAVVREGKIIKVVVSQGGETVLAPAIVGLPLRNAEMLLRQSQLLLGEVNEAYSLRQEKGTVLAQEPKAESSVERNALVNVVVSGGGPPSGVLLMPDFLRKNIVEARAWASSAGLSIKETKDPSALFPSGIILTQTPFPDTVVVSNSKISFVVSARVGKGPEPATRNFTYQLAQGGSDSLLRIVLVDKYGERELFNGLRKPGSKIEIPLQESGGARIKIYLNGILVEERDL